MRVFCFAQNENNPHCTTVSYLFTYLLPDSARVRDKLSGRVYLGNELPDNGSPTCAVADI